MNYSFDDIPIGQQFLFRIKRRDAFRSLCRSTAHPVALHFLPSFFGSLLHNCSRQLKLSYGIPARYLSSSSEAIVHSCSSWFSLVRNYFNIFTSRLFVFIMCLLFSRLSTGSSTEEPQAFTFTVFLRNTEKASR